MNGFKPKPLGACFCCGKPISPAIGKYGIRISKYCFHHYISPEPIWDEVGELCFHISCFLSVAGSNFCPSGKPFFFGKDKEKIKLKKKKKGCP